MLVTILRPPNDTFTFRMFFNFFKRFPEADWFYIWASALESAKIPDWWANELEYRNTFFDLIKSKIVVLGLKDHLTPTNGFDPWSEDIPAIAEYIRDMIDFYQNKKFIIFTSLENLNSYIDRPNAFIIPWGGDITNQHTQYAKLNPVLEKDFSSNYTFISLNRNPRFHRSIAISILFGLKLNDYGMITCLYKEGIKYQNQICTWPVPDSIFDIINKGQQNISSEKFFSNDSKEIYSKNFPNDNVNNFKTKLQGYYKNSFVEIINETSFTERCFLITEKTLNSIYGCNFPIWISSKGTVRFLRDIGLDVFDDIIDHSYDNIDDPVTRIYEAIEKNKNLLKNSDLVKALWKQNIDRFKRNIEFSKSDMLDYYQTRAESEFEKVINSL